MKSAHRLLFLLSILLLMSACSDDGAKEGQNSNNANNTNNADNVNNLDPDASMDDMDGSVEEAAYLVFNRIRTPTSRTMIASVIDDLAHGQLDVEAGFEQSGFSRAREFQGKIYTFDGEDGSITRWRVNDQLELVEDVLDDGSTPASFSMAREGVSSFSTPMAFVDAETAIYFDFFFGQSQVIVWNPTEMIIEDVIQVPEMQRDGLDPQAKDAVVVDDFVVLPISWSDFFQNQIIETTAMAIFSASDGSFIEIVEDDRCVAARDPFVRDGKVYLVGDSVRGLAPLAVPSADLPPPCLLRWTPGESEFDSDFYVDLEAALGTSLLSGALGRGGDTAVFLTYTSNEDPESFGLREILDENVWQWQVYDIAADENRIVDTIPAQGVSSLGWVIDGEYLVPRFDAEAGETSLYRIDDDGSTELLTVTGEIFYVSRIR